MDNLNNGSIVDFNQIKDYQKSARYFSEGNEELEQLLLNCFGKGIKTTACCGGHEDKNRKPYISFSYSSENEQYIYAIISKLKDSGFSFRYNKLSNGKSFFSIEEGQSFDFSKTSTLFNNINHVINSFDIEKDYYTELPKDLQKYSSIIKISENDEFLKADGTSNYFQMCYEKKADGYEYSMFASDSYYNSVAEKENFTKISMMGMFPSYNLKVSNREMAIQGLNGIAANIQTFGNKQSETSNHQHSQPIKQKEDKIELGFEYDERTRSNPLENHLIVNPGDTIEIVSKKLGVCREKGINAFAIFNGVEVNNYMSDNPQQIVEAYNQSKNKIYEMDVKKMMNQNQYEQNQQNLSSIEGVTRSRNRDNLNEAINERLDRIEHAKANGQYISEEDWKFAIEHGGGPYQRTGGGDFRRIDIMRQKEDNHFRTRQYIEDEKEMAIDRQKQIQDIQQTYLDNLESVVLAGNIDPNTITQTTQAIQQLNELGHISPQVDTNVKQPHLRSEEQIRANQQAIEAFGQDLKDQNKSYEHFIHMRNVQKHQDQLLRQQQLGQLSQQDTQQMGGMGK